MKNNDDQRMKDLTNRLVAMSPEPPPFPEEVTMSTPARKTTMKPLTVFAAAAVVVLLGFGIPFLLLSGGEPPVAGPDTTTTTLAESTTTEPTTTSSAPGESTTTTAPGAAYGAEVFVYQSPENSFRGNPALVPFETVVELDADASDVEVLQASLNLLGNPELTLPADFMNEVPEGVEALNVRRADGTDNALIIDMNEAFLAGAGGLLADFTMLNQLIYTATQLDGIDEVQFIVGNQQVTEFGSDGLDLSSSVNRGTFQEELALIYLTEPIVLDGDGTVDVIGSSNTFEASVNLRIIDANGEIVHEEFTTATSGSGTWGEYQFSLDESLVTPASSIQVFDFSAEDGEPENIVTIPVSEGPWALLP